MNTRRLITHVSVLLLFLLATSVTIAQTVPILVYFSGSLTDDTGTPLPDGSYVMEFNFYASESGGTTLLTDSHPSVQVSGGLYSVKLGSGTLTSGGVYNNLGELFQGVSTIWLGIRLPSDDEMSPRIQVLSSSYAIQAENSSKVDGHDYDSSWPTTLTTIQNATSGDFHNIGGTDDDIPDSDAEVLDNISINNGAIEALSGLNNVGIGTAATTSRLTVNGGILRSGSTQYGTSIDTHMNLGVTSNTGAFGDNFSYVTVSGGENNNATRSGSTISGGRSNTATGENSVISGGSSNTTSELGATVAGGVSNTASGFYSAVLGGQSNEATGSHSAVTTGISSVAGGTYSQAGGRRAKANHAGSFVWADATDADFASTADNQFLIRANGNVGINTASPLSTLHIQGTAARLFHPTNSFGWGAKLNFGDSEFVYLQEDSDDNLTVKANRIAITGGNVGVGTDSPTHKLEVNGSAHVEGTLTWQAKTGRISVPPAAFQADSGFNSYDIKNYAWKLERTSGPTTTDYTAFAPVLLPDGATVTKVSSFWYGLSTMDCTTGLSEVNLLLNRNSLQAYTDQNMTDVCGSSAATSFGSASETSISYATIDNSNYTYYLKLFIPDHGSAYYLGAVIEYSFTAPY